MQSQSPSRASNCFFTPGVPSLLALHCLHSFREAKLLLLQTEQSQSPSRVSPPNEFLAPPLPPAPWFLSNFGLPPNPLLSNEFPFCCFHSISCASDIWKEKKRGKIWLENFGLKMRERNMKQESTDVKISVLEKEIQRANCVRSNNFQTFLLFFSLSEIFSEKFSHSRTLTLASKELSTTRLSISTSSSFTRRNRSTPRFSSEFMNFLLLLPFDCGVLLLKLLFGVLKFGVDWFWMRFDD